MTSLALFDSAELPTAPKTLRPPLKWAGGKRWLVPYIQNLESMKPGRRLVEPFVGGMAVALALRPTRALLNDRNVHLINFFRQLQRGLEITIPMANDSETYYAHRRRFNDLIRNGEAETPEAANLFYYLNRTGFNGLCRFNSSGEFNVPVGSYARIAYRRDFTEYAPVLREWTIRSGDFETLEIMEDDFIYADPPYDVQFTTYSPGGFSWEDQLRLVSWLDRHTGPIVASNQATPKVLKLYRKHGFQIDIVDGPRRISSNGDRSPAREMVATRGFE